VNYRGVVVLDADAETSNLPLFSLFISAADFDGLYGTKMDDDKFSVVVAFGNQVIDNALIRVRGQSSRRQRKINYKVELPDGYTIDLAPHASYPLDEFALQADRLDVPFIQTLSAWNVAFEEGEPELANFHIRLQKNGEFFGLYRLQELYDGRFRSQQGYDNGEFFKATGGGWLTLQPGRLSAFEKREPDDGDMTLILEANDALRDRNQERRTAWAYRNIDIPAIINYSALFSLIHHGDQLTKNYYVYRNADTGRWSQLFWDLDQSWRGSKYGSCPKDRMTEPSCVKNRLLDAVLEVPEFEEMYWRRMRTIVDRYLAPGRLEQVRIDAMQFISEEEGAQDALAWGGNNGLWRRNFVTDPYHSELWNDAIQRRRVAYAEDDRLPPTVSAGSNVIITEIHYNPSDGSEFLELFNPNPYAIDLSGWVVDGVDFDFRAGSVIGALAYAVLTDNDRQLFATLTENVFVPGQYSGKLSNKGEQLTLIDASGNVVDEVDYDDGGDWPAAADGSGFSLELVAIDVDNSLATSWQASDTLGGTPGAPPSVTGPGNEGSDDEEDCDGDGVGNLDDAFPLDPTESIDTDGDGEGNNADDDDDGDGQTDVHEVTYSADPLDATIQAPDTDGDGIPDCLEDGGIGGIDSDGDGVQDTLDVCPVTMVPESVPTRMLANHRYALTANVALGSGDPVLFTSTPVRFVYTTALTSGCSCEQILDLTGNIRVSERQSGCARSTLNNFIDEVAAGTYWVP